MVTQALTQFSGKLNGTIHFPLKSLLLHLAGGRPSDLRYLFRYLVLDASMELGLVPEPEKDFQMSKEGSQHYRWIHRSKLTDDRGHVKR